MKKYIYSIVALFILCNTLPIHAQEDNNKGITWASLRGLEYEVKAGFSIGGTSPLPLPEEIRSIDGYSPSMAISVEGNVKKWLDEKKQWGIQVGLRLENKTMNTEATVKNYSMEIIGDGGERVKGVWTGGVKTKVKNSYLTLPVVGVYKVSKRWNVKAGPYISYLLEGDFSGNVYEGYLRQDNSAGPKVEFTDDKIATYNFSNELRKFQWGMQLGGEWRAFKHLNVYADLTWGLNDIFKKDFDTVSFAMYPIYLNVGFGYAF